MTTDTMTPAVTRIELLAAEAELAEIDSTLRRVHDERYALVDAWKSRRAPVGGVKNEDEWLRHRRARALYTAGRRWLRERRA